MKKVLKRYLVDWLVIKILENDTNILAIVKK